MGGDTVSFLNSTIDDDDVISTAEIPTLWPGGLSGETAGENESVIDAMSFRDYYRTLETGANEKRVYEQLLKNYADLNDRVENMEAAKSKVLSYTPGSWVENVGGMTMSDYNVPKTTTLVLIGPKGSGKSSLVNRISRVFEDDKFAPERAQVAYNSSMRDGTSFLQEYMVPRNSTSFCFYDTRGFSNNLSENLEMINQWMTKGVRHGELMKSSILRGRMKSKNGQDKLLTYERRRVDFVIFVVNGLSVLKCMENSGADTQYVHTVTEVFSSPSLSFKDHKPVIAITHGDLLSISERARVRVYLGHLLGVHPSKQTFDIPDNCELTTELTIVDLVRYALEHADRNLPCKSRPAISKGTTIQLWTHLLLLLVVGIFMLAAHLHGFRSLKLVPESVPEPSLEIKEVLKFDQESVPKPDLELKKVPEIDPEIFPVLDLEIKITEFDKKIVPDADLEIRNVTGFDQEIVPEAVLEIRKVMEFDQEIVPEADQEIREVTEFDQEIVPEADGEEIKKVTEFDQEIVPEADLEIKKVTDVDQEIVPEPDLEIKEVTEVDESDLEIKEVTEIDPGIVPEHILEMKKVIPGSNTKPSKKTKNSDAERVPGKNKKMKKVRVPEAILEIDWKTIRHIW